MSPSDSLNLKITRLHGWLDAGGAQRGAVAIHHDGPDVRALHTTRAVQAGEDLLRIPEAFVISEAMVHASPLGQKLVRGGLTHPTALYTAFVCEAGGDAHSFWRPYLALLPSNFRNMPTMHAGILGPALHGTWALQVMVHDAKWALMSYQTTVRLAPEFARHGFGAYMYAYYVARTRAFGID